VVERRARELGEVVLPDPHQGLAGEFRRGETPSWVEGQDRVRAKKSVIAIARHMVSRSIGMSKAFGSSRWSHEVEIQRCARAGLELFAQPRICSSGPPSRMSPSICVSIVMKQLVGLGREDEDPVGSRQFPGLGHGLHEGRATASGTASAGIGLAHAHEAPREGEEEPIHEAAPQGNTLFSIISASASGWSPSTA